MTASFYGRVIRGPQPPALTPDMKANIAKVQAEAEATAQVLRRAMARLETVTTPKAE